MIVAVNKRRGIEVYFGISFRSSLWCFVVGRMGVIWFCIVLVSFRYYHLELPSFQMSLSLTFFDFNISIFLNHSSFLPPHISFDFKSNCTQISTFPSFFPHNFINITNHFDFSSHLLTQIQQILKNANVQMFQCSFPCLVSVLISNRCVPYPSFSDSSMHARLSMQI